MCRIIISNFTIFSIHIPVGAQFKQSEKKRITLHGHFHAVYIVCWCAFKKIMKSVHWSLVLAKWQTRDSRCCLYIHASWSKYKSTTVYPMWNSGVQPCLAMGYWSIRYQSCFHCGLFVRLTCGENLIKILFYFFFIWRIFIISDTGEIRVLSLAAWIVYLEQNINVIYCNSSPNACIIKLRMRALRGLWQID